MTTSSSLDLFGGSHHDGEGSGSGKIFRRILQSVVDSAAPSSSSEAADGEGGDSSLSSTDFYTGGETTFELVMDGLFGVAFLITAIFAAKRMTWTRQQGGSETTVVTAFYSLILVTSVLRAVWFLIPATVWTPSYTPVAVFAWDAEHPSWIGAFLSETVLTAGSLALFSIFILILVYWADILKKYFHPASRRSIPMVTFLMLVAMLVALEVINMACFLCKLYSTEGMILYNSVLLAAVSIVCVCEITIFSHRFRTVLKTLGAINQVSTDSQVKRIVWITVTGNLFFFTRAFLETVFCVYLLMWWKHEHTVARAFSHAWWDTYVAVKFLSEITILSLMLYILQSRFASNAAANASGYSSVPNAETESNGHNGSGGGETLNV
mmetsp:Transcript_39289/g.95010  ORF Transcript_39289/g.95010 Transcript_39289/m.95010 type:complete len:380 (-) Transcript_39289:1229-2368(-)|eukprot:CAMPEP_0113483576 /NCGR_PEP_ID=MMETSP0014_2-20120614/23505_1 /TAXON_ID=2857 /ORGANISM="Nitzschia sp." /LENGTH=379 /DNA_ID=CAMNT_0000377127 /DNA_START=199 /DNA_END=1338 /DNA_ORIENTATION=+ /assembly_acc=CAM_ASM_000159